MLPINCVPWKIWLLIASHAFTGVVRLKLKLCLSCFFLCLGLDVSANHFLRWSLQWRQDSLCPKFLFGPSRPCTGSWTFCLRDLLVFFLMVSVTILTAYFGGITIYRWIWSGFIPIFIYPQLGSYFLISWSLIFKMAFYSWNQDLSTITGYPDDMILGLVYGMDWLV